MDGLASQQTQARERRGSRSSSTRPRAPSRASTSMSNSRSANQSSANSSTAQLASTLPARPSTVVHHSHKHHHATCRTPTTPRPQSTAPRESTINGPHSVMSSYLQERLQRRREESERNAAVRLVQDMSTPVEPASRTAQSSPIKGISTDGKRPQSSGGSERSEPTKKKGMGVKEMEATVSTLHKQNFDLKLELYHRRERQTALEERADALDFQKTQLEDVNDKLLEELEKRDKAVQEAVQMIVLLEAQVEKLVKEREIVRQVEATGFSRFAELQASLNAPAPAAKIPDLARLEEDVKVINRMPSFLSEKSESTANLRRVYLGTQGSLLSLPKVSEVPSTTADYYGHNRSVSKELRSPSLSDLSESSFTSVYGDKSPQDNNQAVAEGSPVQESQTVASVNRRRTSSNASDAAMAPRTRMPTASTRSHRSGSFSRQSTGTFQSINDVVEQGSPLQRLERSYSSHGDSPSAEKSSRAAKSQIQKQSRQEKRDGLRRVMTDGPGRPHYDHVLPPTPDTISTSTLRRFKPSNETLSHPQPNTERSYLALSEGPASTAAGEEKPEPIPEHNGGAPVSMPVPPTPVAANKVFTGGSYFANRTPLAPRPRSADETTVSHRKDNPWDSDDDDNASVRSLESSLDIWLQQGKEPKRGGGRGSPDMFGFPSTANRWEPNAMYGQGASLAAGGAPLHWPDPLDDLLPIQEALFGGSGPAPPPPNRRSSLHARTGSTSTSTPVVVKHPEPTNSKLRRAFSRATRRNSDESRIRPSVERTPQASEAKQTTRSPYPPLSRPGTVTPRNPRRINSLWRRSLGGTGSAPSPTPNPAPQQESAPERAAAANNSAARSNSMVGTPSWVQRGKFADEDMRDLGATPPPIQRQPRRSSFVDGADGASVYDYGPQTPSTPVAQNTMSPAGEGTQQGAGGASLGNGTPNSSRRKWLPGFGRTSSLRNRAG